MMLLCEVHNAPLRFRGGAWRCLGWDGEGCGAGGPDGISPAAAARLAAGQTYWPGVIAWLEIPSPCSRSAAR